MPAITTTHPNTHRFVPRDFDPADLQPLQALYERLDATGVATQEQLESFILDWQELQATISEAYAEAYVDMTSDTTNPAYEQRFVTVVEQIMPLAEQRDFNLKRKLLASPAFGDLGPEYEVFLRDIRSQVALFREENLPLFVEERKMDQEYEKLVGAQQAEFRGESLTLPQLERFLEEPDRTVREEVWRLRSDVKLRDSVPLDELFDRLYKVRQQIAHNAGFANYRDYKFEELKRFDYTPDDCLGFHEAIEKHIVPVINREMERRRRLMGVDTLRPWDVAVVPRDPMVDPESLPPLRPFDSVERLKEGCERIFNEVDPELGRFFHRMIDEHLLDLESRPGKSPGGYMMSFAGRRVPFIFMNAVGTKQDVDTVLHEGGHAFHYFLATRQPLISYHHATMEFSEVASMTMELLARPYISEFFKDEEIKRIHDDQLRASLNFFPWMAMIDAFQHWVYTSEEHGAEARRAKWAELEQRFRPYIDWTGVEQYRGVVWQYPHVFDVPFYYVEYGIAQLAALRIWLNSLQDERAAVEAYKRALSLGGSRHLPELFTSAGAEFGLDDRIVGAIVAGTLEHIPGDI